MDDMRWRLEDIYPDQERWEQDFISAKQRLAAFGSYRGRLGESTDLLLDALQARDWLRETCTRIYDYAGMKFDGDTTDPDAQGLRDRAMSLATEAAAAISFMAPELLALTEETIASFLQSEPRLGIYRFELDDLLRYRPHTLSPAEEEIIARAGEVAQAPDQIFKMIDNADLTFDSIRGEDGQEMPVTRGNYSVLMQSDFLLALWRLPEAFQHPVCHPGRRSEARPLPGQGAQPSVIPGLRPARRERHPGCLR